MTNCLWRYPALCGDLWQARGCGILCLFDNSINGNAQQFAAVERCSTAKGTHLANVSNDSESNRLRFYLQPTCHTPAHIGRCILINLRRLTRDELDSIPQDELIEAFDVINEWTAPDTKRLAFYQENRDELATELYRQAQIALDRPEGLSVFGIAIAEWMIRIIPRLSPEMRPSTNPRPGYVYLIQSPTTAYKIGRTQDPDDRIKTFSVKLPFEVNYIRLIYTDDMYALEKALHDYFADKRINGEWFELEDADVTYLKHMLVADDDL